MAFASRAEQLEDLFEGFNGDYDTLRAAMIRHFSDDCVWSNAGLPTTHGPQEAFDLMKGSGDVTGMARCRIETHKSVASGDVLLNERTDYIIDGNGDVMFELDIAGVFVFEGDKIVSWREYFDPANAQSYAIEHGLT